MSVSKTSSIGEQEEMPAVEEPPVQEPPIQAVPMEGIRFDEVPWCEITRIGLKIEKGNVDFVGWLKLQPYLTIFDKGSNYCIGDWALIGYKRHGDKIAQAIDVHDKTGIKVKVLTEYQRVSEKVPYSIRMESLDWSHGQIVAGLKSLSERKKWLQLAAKKDWQPAELRKAIHAAAKPAVNSESDTNYLDPHYKSLLTDYVATLYSFLNRCNYEPMKREIERAIKWARYQLKRQPGTDREAVKEQIDKMCVTAEEVAEEVPISEAEIEKIFKWIIENCSDVYEWRKIGAAPQLENHHGTSSLGIYRKDAPHYERSSGPSAADYAAGEDGEEHF